ncbi:MAG: hypothetical protein BZ138_01315 [Methanosphaera sp. rholeuAM270]|nr:MAG: hypothetical protein BZ138_01315 [Methanosphaera sp. rholeuAM270]
MKERNWIILVVGIILVALLIITSIPQNDKNIGENNPDNDSQHAQNNLKTYDNNVIEETNGKENHQSKEKVIESKKSESNEKNN